MKTFREAQGEHEARFNFSGIAADESPVGGTIVLAGVKGFKPVNEFISDYVVTKEVQVMGAMGVTSRGYKAAINLIESGRVDLMQMHTHDFVLKDAELAIRTLAREIPDDASIHSCLIPEH